MFSKLMLGFLFVSTSLFASYEAADSTYGKGTIALSGHRRTIIELVRGGYYFSVIPWMKDFLVRSEVTFDGELDAALDSIINATGVKPFESLPENVLRKSKSGNIRYILAKKFFKLGEFQQALSELHQVSADHSSYPFVANMKGAVYSGLAQYQEAETQFRDCIRISDRKMSGSDSRIQKNQLAANRDYCVAGIARVQFAKGDYKNSEINYLDIPKSSYIWPEILFEEAWTSYYVKNYNRTLGKLISYKAPVFDFIFKPEVEVLKALTYLKMCLYDDAKKTADGFYNDLLNPSRELRTFLTTRGKDYDYYYSLMADHEKLKPSPLPIVDSILKSVRKDSAFLELKGALSQAMGEYNNLRKRPNGSMKVNLMKNLKTVLSEYRTIIGAYIRAGLVSKYAELYSAFQGMSYIKLEVLAERKEKLYQNNLGDGGKRGDIKYIDRNDKQYFWTFNGEFWADELGDYVFALRSEC